VRPSKYRKIEISCSAWTRHRGRIGSQWVSSSNDDCGSECDHSTYTRMAPVLALFTCAIGSIRANRARVRASSRSSSVDFLRSSARCAHAPRSLRVPTCSTPGTPTANASPSPTRSDSAASSRTLLSSPSDSCQLLFQHYFPRFIQHAIPARSISQVQTDGQFLLAKIPRLPCPAVLIFFIAGLLYLLRFERVDNLEGYRIPPETGLLIPSGFVS
jgi:hypothetical protein